MVDAGVVVETVQLCSGSYLQQVLIAFVIFCKKQQMEGRTVEFRVLVLHTTGCHVGFQANDGLDPFRFGGFVEVDHAKHRAMVGDGNRVHVHFFNAFDQLLDI